MKELWNEYIALTITVMVILFLLIGSMFYMGGANVVYKKTIGKWSADADREVFEHSQSYIDGINQEATKLYLEYIQLNNEDSKKAYKGVIRSKFADVDLDLIKNAKTKKFIQELLNEF